ncbi:uncharacterized protein LOC127700692 [Mytilus californianus]|uniref:uncharacterized protein LOC127700692 n=1 Tax=Mytilus californianus TaxID=6549 RepID=UPI0022487573|nr:uncharacterized protein LOC127700692 [Mytilus californianus]
MKRILYLSYLVFICLKGVESLTNLQIYTVGQAVLGPSHLELRCSYNLESRDDIFSIDISAELNSQFRTIVAFYPENRRKDGTLRYDGNYLNGRVTMNNPKQSSNVAVLIFNQTECIDETKYKCRVTYDSDMGTQTKESAPTAIVVEGSPAEPDSVPSYIPSVVEEGNTVVFTCTGNVGKPQGKFRWILYRRNANGMIIQESLYENKTSTGLQMPGTCTFNGTSQLTLQMESLDNNAVVRCQVVYQAVPQGHLYKQTTNINVYYSVRNVTAAKSKLNDTYDPGSITLTCTSDGNPAVRNEDYRWYKMSQQYTVIGTGSQLTVTNATVGESDVYLCVAQNSFNGKTFSSNSSIEVKIGKILQS